MLGYRLEGVGPPLLLIHGFGVTYDIWRELAPRLRPHFQLIMVELPGMGQSPRAAPHQPYYRACVDGIEAVRHELGLSTWSILSYSVGTRVAEPYIRTYPGRVHRAVYLCPLYIAGWRWRSLQALTRLDRRCPAVGNWLLSGWRLHRLIVLLGFNGRRLPLAREWFHEIQSQPMASLKAVFFDLPDPGQSMLEPVAPTLYVWGSRDLVTSRPAPLRAHDRTVCAGHSAPMSAASGIAALVVPFLLGG